VQITILNFTSNIRRIMAQNGYIMQNGKRKYLLYTFLIHTCKGCFVVLSCGFCYYVQCWCESRIDVFTLCSRVFCM